MKSKLAAVDMNELFGKNKKMLGDKSEPKKTDPKSDDKMAKLKALRKI